MWWCLQSGFILQQLVFSPDYNIIQDQSLVRRPLCVGRIIIGFGRNKGGIYALPKSPPTGLSFKVPKIERGLENAAQGTILGLAELGLAIISKKASTCCSMPATALVTSQPVTWKVFPTLTLDSILANTSCNFLQTFLTL